MAQTTLPIAILPEIVDKQLGPVEAGNSLVQGQVYLDRSDLSTIRLMWEFRIVFDLSRFRSIFGAREQTVIIEIDVVTMSNNDSSNAWDGYISKVDFGRLAAQVLLQRSSAMFMSGRPTFFHRIVLSLAIRNIAKVFKGLILVGSTQRTDASYYNVEYALFVSVFGKTFSLEVEVAANAAQGLANGPGIEQQIEEAMADE